MFNNIVNRKLKVLKLELALDGVQSEIIDDYVLVYDMKVYATIFGWLINYKLFTRYIKLKYYLDHMHLFNCTKKN